MTKGKLELRRGWDWWLNLDPVAKFAWMLAAIAGLVIAGLVLNGVSLRVLRATDYSTDFSLWLISNTALGFAAVFTLPTLGYGIWRWRRLGRWKIAVLVLGLIVLVEVSVAALILLFILSPGPMRF